MGQSSITDNDFNMSVDISKLSHLNVGKNSTKISLSVSDGKSGKDLKKIKNSLKKLINSISIYLKLVFKSIFNAIKIIYFNPVCFRRFIFKFVTSHGGGHKY